MTTEQVQRIVKKIGLRPQQAAGQNFLLDRSVAASMVSAADITSNDTVLEIGAGLGILTEELLAAGANVIAIELDHRLAAYLERKFSGQPKLRLIESDIFKVNLPTLLRDGQYKLVANLPYSATSLVFRNFLSLAPRPSSLTVMIQAEVAERITAEPGQLSVLAVMVQSYSQVERLFDVPPASFYPAPSVQSAVVYCHDLRPVNPEVDKQLFRLVRAGFAARRKFVVKNLAAVTHRPVEEIAQGIESLGLKTTVRAQEIPVELWPKIQKILS